MQPETILKKYWGYPNFRSGQKEIISSVLANNDTVAILPTGGGKSVCFQVPALIFSGITIIISPLLSLIQDQVDALKKKDIAATSITSTLSEKEKQKRLAKIKEHAYKLRVFPRIAA